MSDTASRRSPILEPARLESLVEGAVGFLRGPDSIQPIRLPERDLDLMHPSLRSPFTAEAAAGIRLRLRTEARVIRLQVSHAIPDQYPGEPTYDLLVEGSPVPFRRRSDGTLPLTFDGLPSGDKTVEIWFPPGLGVRLHGLTVEPDVGVAPAPHDGPRWVVYGSSITHCAWVPPTDTWPSIAARALGWNLTCLGFNGGCHLDPFTARAMAALPADRFTLKLGINVHNLQTLRERTFAPLVHGFIATLRDSHPTTPITVVSPIISPSRETSVISDIPVLSGTGAALVGDLTLSDIRAALQQIVEVLRQRGDDSIDYLDGRHLFGASDVDHLPDGLHPDADGYTLIARRFIARHDTHELEET